MAWTIAIYYIRNLGQIFSNILIFYTFCPSVSITRQRDKSISPSPQSQESNQIRRSGIVFPDGILPGTICPEVNSSLSVWISGVYGMYLGGVLHSASIGWWGQRCLCGLLFVRPWRFVGGCRWLWCSGLWRGVCVSILRSRQCRGRLWFCVRRGLRVCLGRVGICLLWRAIGIVGWGRSILWRFFLIQRGLLVCPGIGTGGNR